MTLPAPFITRTRALFGARGDRIIDALTGQPIRAARVNTLKIGRDDFFALAGAFTSVPFTADGFYADDRIRGDDPYHLAGLYYVQEASAQLPVNAAAGYIKGRVLDLCAAPGGKTCQLAACRPDVLYANETVFKRASALKSNIERLGVRSAVVTCNTADDYAERLPGFFDTVLVDAPCSGEGMFRKGGEAAAHWSEANVLACADRSVALLKAAAATLKEGGVLLYSTCTLNYEENEGVIARFLATCDFTPLPPAPAVLAHAEPGLLENTVRILPDTGAGEGHFACVMRKNYGGEKKHRPLPVRRCKTDVGKLWTQLADVPMWCDPVERDGAVWLAPELYGSLNYLSAGVKIAEINKTVRPYHSLALSLTKGETAQSLDFHPGDPRLQTYLQGGELDDPPFKGWGTVTVDGWPLGLIKCGDTIKNHYPKGLLLLKKK